MQIFICLHCNWRIYREQHEMSHMIEDDNYTKNVFRVQVVLTFHLCFNTMALFANFRFYLKEILNKIESYSHEYITVQLVKKSCNSYLGICSSMVYYIIIFLNLCLLVDNIWNNTVNMMLFCPSFFLSCSIRKF